jgi:hypothetical protein
MILAGVSSCATNHARSPSEGIDHLVFAISDLDRGIEQLGELCGVAPSRGGKHEHAATENALLSVDSRAYLEVLAPLEGAQLPPELQPLRSIPDLMPVSWAVSSGSLDLTRVLLESHGYGVSEPRAGSRVTNDGQTIRWRTIQLTAPKIEGAPFFIEWDLESPHPAQTSPAGCALLSLEVRTPQDEELSRLLRLLNVEAQVIRGEASGMTVTLEGAHGAARLPVGS